MFVTRMRQQVEAAEARARESEQRSIKTCHLNIRLEFMQNIETSVNDEEKAVDSPEKQAPSPAKRLVSQDESIQKRILSGDGEASFFKKNNPRRSLSSGACSEKTEAWQDREQTTRRHSSPELASRR
ncbi:MAG: hypothetical protein P1U36_06240 [Legionellaceae bacterium]|nr:hypothetical protein [Legionellaceae bacterium]